MIPCGSFSRHCPKSCLNHQWIIQQHQWEQYRSQTLPWNTDTSFCFFAYSVTHLLSWFPALLQGPFCLKDGLKCSLPSLQFILPATWAQHIPRASGCSALCHGCYYCPHLPKYLSRASSRWIYFIVCYRSLRGSLFLGKAMSSISSGLMKALRCLSTNRCCWRNCSCGLRFYAFVISLLQKKILIILILSLLYWECRALCHIL